MTRDEKRERTMVLLATRLNVVQVQMVTAENQAPWRNSVALYGDIAAWRKELRDIELALRGAKEYP